MPKVKKLGVDEDNAILKETIKSMKKQCGLKNSELAQIIGKKDRATNYRLSDVNRFTVGELKRLAKYFGVKLIVKFEIRGN